MKFGKSFGVICVWYTFGQPCGFLQAECQIHNGHPGDKNMEGHARELPIQLWDDLAHSLGSTSGYKDDVLGSLTAIISQLSRRTIHRLLSGSDGVDCGHESFHNTKVVMDDLGRGRGGGGDVGLLEFSNSLTCIHKP
ncbi:hypothetical protein STEG23_015915 [Scotinomys teguina]